MTREELAHEEFNELLILDWRHDTEMAHKNKPVTPGEGVGRDEVHRIVSGQLKALKDELVIALRPAEKRPGLNHPWVVSLGSAVIGGLIVGAAVLFVQGSAAKDSENLNLKISAEISRQMEPIRADIRRQGEEIAKIKGADGIAKTTPSQDGPVKDFSTIKRNLAVAAANGLTPAPAELESLRYALLQVDQKAAGYWPTVLYVVAFRSHYALVNPSAVKPMRIVVAGTSKRNSFENSVLELSGKGELSDSMFTNCIIKFSRKEPLKMKNVRFVNCAFIFEVIAEPTPRLKSIGEELLKAANPKDLIISVG